ncbi:hypothetical protein EV426DRAFT_603841 [Tirmania nivea]|nr:hypothetical protein EV426DRAFT_603841 [Tirmania nivea]
MEESVDTREENATSTVGLDEGEESRNKVAGGAGPDGSVREGSSVREKPRTVSAGSEHDPSRSDNSDGEGGDRPGEFLVDSFFLRLLPVRIDCHRGGIVMGNNNTPTILVAKFRDADGIVDATPSRGPDYYKQVFNLHFVNPVISIQENFDFKESQLERGARIMTEQPVQPKLWTTVRDLLPSFYLSQESLIPTAPSNSRNPRHDRWMGLPRYLDENEVEEKSHFEPAEYAVVTTILDSPEVRMTMYWDVPGDVRRHASRSWVQRENANDINGDIPPEWGIDLAIQGGTVNYGPWADRQRIELQNLFFPRLYKDAIAAKPLGPGDTRQATAFRLFVELKDSIMLRVPIREESKDWKFKKRLDEGELRAFGWLDLKIDEGTISDDIAMVASETGYGNKLQFDFKNCEVRTSVNNGLFLKADQLAMVGDLSNPLEWNGPRHWTFNLTSRSPKFFLLREHVTLLTDLIGDWASGPPQDYFTFSPFKYDMNLRFTDFEIYLNVNDGNIINNPSDLDDNTFLMLKGDELKSFVHLPMHRLRPPFNEISFTVDVGTLRLSLHTPPWSTQVLFLEVADVAAVNDFMLKGKYKYHATTSSDLVDTLLLDILGMNLNFTFYGVLIRYFLIIRENYFGENLHFKTLEEYKRKDQDSTAVIEKPIVTNGLDVILAVEVKDSFVLLPAHIYSAKQFVRLDLAYLGLDMRFTNLYMDLQVNCSPISASLSSVESADTTPKGFLSPTQLFLDNLVIYGHRLFGLPPTEPTYVCNWDLSFGNLTGECNVEFLRTLLFGLRVFNFNLDDVENALPPTVLEVLYDITFLRVIVKSVRIWLRVSPSAFLLSTDEINFTLNDWANELFSDRISLSTPGLTLACVDEESVQRQRGKQHSQSLTEFTESKTHAYISTDLLMTVFGHKSGATEKREHQQRHVQDHDFQTGRAAFLLQHSTGQNSITGDQKTATSSPMSAPSMPPPLYEAPVSPYSAGGESISETSSHHSNTSGRKSSFLTSRPSSSRSAGSVLNRTISSTSPSFHSAVQTVSETLLATPRTGRQRLDSPLFPNSQPPSRRPSPSMKRAPLKPGSRSRFSSTYSKPYFPLQDVELDMANVPPLDLGIDQPWDETQRPQDASMMSAEEKMVRNSVVLDLGQGVRAYCDPAAIHGISQILQGLQPQSAEDILDDVQIEVIDRLAKLTKQTRDAFKVLELCLKIPQFKFRFVNPAPPNIPEADNHTTDVFDLNLMKAFITVRSKEIIDMCPTSEGSPQISPSLSLDFSVRTLQLTVGLKQSDPAAQLFVEDVTAWALTSELSTGSVKVKSISSLIESKQGIFLCDLAERTGQLASSFGGAFSRLAEQGEKRPRDLLYALAKGQEDHSISNEPSSITRPSYVLRSSLNHVRVHDSWKINSRIRHIYRSLPIVVQHELDARTRECSGSSPGDARRQVIESFDRWRGWELGNIQDSYLIEGVFGKKRRVSRPKSMPSTASLVVNLDKISLYVDPGPTQQEALVNGFVAAVSMARVFEQKPGPKRVIVLETAQASTIVQGHCRNAQIRLTWEVLETAEKILRYLRQKERAVNQSTTFLPKTILSPTKRARFKQQYHVVLSADTGSIGIDTVNLKLICIGHSLRASLVASGKNTELQEGLIGSLLVRADIASSELSYQNKVLSVASLRQPVFYAYLDQHSVAETIFNYWKATGSCRDLSFELREEVLGLMEVIDFVVNDEVSYVNRLMVDLEKSKPALIARNVSHSRRTVNLVDLALKLDTFTISAALLPSLVYFVRGKGIRMSTRPKNKTESIIEFDLIHHEHEVRTGYRSQPVTISLLQIPTINGRVRKRDGVEESLLEPFFSVEAIEFDASAIQSLLNALNKPEVVNVIESARKEWAITEARLDQIFGPSKLVKQSRPKGPRLVYRAHVGIAGVKIETHAPSASFEINLGAIQVYASNKPNKALQPLDIPEVYVELKHITVGLFKKVPKNNLPEPCGHITLHASLLCSSEVGSQGKRIRAFYLRSHSFKFDISPETASTVVDVTGHLQDKLKDFNLSPEVKYLRKLRKSNKPALSDPADVPLPPDDDDLFNSIFSVELNDIQISWITGNSLPAPVNRPRQNLILTCRRIGFESALKKHNEARLIIEELLLQMVDENSPDAKVRAENSALLPEVVFVVTHHNGSTERRFASQAKGLPLDLRLTPSCMLGVNDLEASLAIASDKFRKASASWKSTPTVSGGERKNMFSKKRLASVLVDADFAGAVVHFQTSIEAQDSQFKPAHQGRFGQFAQGDSNANTTLRTPGLAFKIQYLDPSNEDPSISGEIKVSSSANIIYPSVVPLLMEMSDNLKGVVRKPNTSPELKPVKVRNEEKVAGDAAAILGRCKLNLGLRIMKQEFSLSCQPYARVAATATYKDIYVTLNTCEDEESGRFYSVSAITTGLRCSLQHIYSRESTGYLEFEALAISVMNNRHLSGSDGLSVIMKLSPLKSQVNVKQIQDFLLFREIWVPEDAMDKTPSPASTPELPAQLMQKYHKVTATRVFPWNTTIAISMIDLQLDLGPSLGKTRLQLSNFWIASRKSSDWEQTMCLGLSNIAIEAAGRLSGFIELVNLQARTSIQWLPEQLHLTPLVQASLGFEQFRIKAAFDYHPFLIADIASFDFLMYNLRQEDGVSDRLVGILEGDKVQIFCTSQSTAQGLALYQAFLRLWQEKIASYETSLQDIERFMRRRTQSMSQPPPGMPLLTSTPLGSKSEPASLTLHTDVVVNLREINIGAFPSTFRDSQVFKVEALNVGARFAVDMDKDKLHSQLSMTLGQLRVALSGVRKSEDMGMAVDVNIEDVISNATGSRGGTILKVPQVNAGMHTWRAQGSNQIDYIFKSAFEGKVDVGWNYARVSFIKGMWQNHLEAMTANKTKLHPSSSSNSQPSQTQPAAITINATNISPPPPGIDAGSSDEKGNGKDKQKEKGKITAVVNVPQSRYSYHPLVPPIIETPQLRDMGEATPPLEWIGLNRDRLPNLTHQIVIVSLLEIAREVEDAYHKILGTGP